MITNNNDPLNDCNEDQIVKVKVKVIGRSINH